MGFEPTERLHAQRFSRPPRSTTPAPLRAWGVVNAGVHSGEWRGLQAGFVAARGKKGWADARADVGSGGLAFGVTVSSCSGQGICGQGRGFSGGLPSGDRMGDRTSAAVPQRAG